MPVSSLGPPNISGEVGVVVVSDEDVEVGDWSSVTRELRGKETLKRRRDGRELGVKGKDRRGRV